MKKAARKASLYGVLERIVIPLLWEFCDELSDRVK